MVSYTWALWPNGSSPTSRPSLRQNWSTCSTTPPTLKFYFSCFIRRDISRISDIILLTAFCYPCPLSTAVWLMYSCQMKQRFKCRVGLSAISKGGQYVFLILKLVHPLLTGHVVPNPFFIKLQNLFSIFVLIPLVIR